MAEPISNASAPRPTANTSRTRVQMVILTGVFAAIAAVCSIISIPLPFSPVPVSLATLGVFLAGIMLGPKYGTLSQLVFILVGAVGVPVFAGFKAGLGVLAGPTGGYIVGYLAGAVVVGLIANAYKGKAAPVRVAVFVLGMVAGNLAIYVLGTAWFVYMTGNPLGAALTMCVIPFLPGDVLKIAAAAALCIPLKKAIKI